MAASPWLIDKSALARLGGSPDAEEWASRIGRGLIRITTVTRLEVGLGPVGAESAGGSASAAAVGNASGVPHPRDRGPGSRGSGGAGRPGLHRAPSVPDLIIAATAELAGLTVLHLD
jgi:predicted nucleic acid-binding protein